MIVAPCSTSASVALVSSSSREMSWVRCEIFAKSTSHSTREAARARARPASASTSAERSSVLLGMQPQYGHSPPTSSRSMTAKLIPVPFSSLATPSETVPAPMQMTSNWSPSARGHP